MPYRLAADAVLLLHLAFILFVLLGAALVARRRWVMLVHLPVAAWGFFVEASGRGCPLTLVENYFRLRAGESGYSEGFIAHYLLHFIYPAGLTRGTELLLAGVVLVVNAVLYGWAFSSHRAGA
jgi:hypothetical protein